MTRTAARATAALAAALLLAACGTGGSPQQEGPGEGGGGVRLAGTVDGGQVSVRDGGPRLVVGDCSPAVGPDEDVCFMSSTIGGETFVLVFENPDLLEDGAELDVADSACRGAACDEVTDHAVVDVQIGEDRQRALGGEVRVDVVEPALRYRGEVRLELADGRLSGEFDVVPRDD